MPRDDFMVARYSLKVINVQNIIKLCSHKYIVYCNRCESNHLKCMFLN